MGSEWGGGPRAPKNDPSGGPVAFGVKKGVKKGVKNRGHFHIAPELIIKVSRGSGPGCGVKYVYV
jgi:hypothetical protein